METVFSLWLGMGARMLDATIKLRFIVVQFCLTLERRSTSHLTNWLYPIRYERMNILAHLFRWMTQWCREILHEENTQSPHITKQFSILISSVHNTNIIEFHGFYNFFPSNLTYEPGLYSRASQSPHIEANKLQTFISTYGDALHYYIP